MMMLKAWHIIAMVAWFAGLFYLPRLFVYHAASTDDISLARFKIMERRLYYGITWPAGLLTTVFGISVMTYNFTYYINAGWMQAKIALVVVLWVYHLTCGHFVKQFKKNNNNNTHTFFRVFNEMPTVLLIAIVLLVVIKPF
jgi:putative membrane protein